MTFEVQAKSPHFGFDILLHLMMNLLIVLEFV